MMEFWYSLSLGDGMTAPTPAEEVEEKFNQDYTTAGKPKEMAVFIRPESEGRLYCEVIAYFSPAAREVALALKAEPCLRPERSGLKLLAGDEAAWSVLFPEQER